MKGIFKIIETKDFDVLVQKYWSQNKEDKEKGDFQLHISFWVEEALYEDIKHTGINLILGYHKESKMIEDYNNADEGIVKKLLIKGLEMYGNQK